MSKLALKIGVPAAISALVVVVLIGRGAADSVLSFEWQTSERLLLSVADAKGANKVTVSPRGTHVAHVVKENEGSSGKHLLYLDGRRVGAYDYVWEIVFSPDGKRNAFWVDQGPNSTDNTFYIVDGKEQQKYSLIARDSAAFSPDGSLFGYSVHSRAEQNFIVMNGIPGKSYELIWGIGRDGAAPLAFSANGKHYGYQAYQDKKSLLVIDGKEHLVEWNLDKHPAFSQDGTRWGWVNLIRTELPGGKVKLENQVLIDGQPYGKIYPEIANNPDFSPDGKRIAFGANTSRREGLSLPEGDGLIVVDGKELEPRYEWVRTIVFSPDNKRLAYEAKRKGKFVVVLDGGESREYDLVHPSSLVFSPDSHRFAYRVSKGKVEYLVVDGVEQGPYNRILTPPVFSSDSRHLVYLAASDKEQFAVIDGTPRNKYEETSVPDSGTNAFRSAMAIHITSEPIQFLTRDSFGYVAKRDGAYYWIEERRVRRLTPPKKNSK